MLELIRKDFKKIYVELFRIMCKLNGDDDFNDKEVNFDLMCRHVVADSVAAVLEEKYTLSDVEHLLINEGGYFALNLNIRALDYLITLLTSDDEERCTACYETHFKELKSHKT